MAPARLVALFDLDLTLLRVPGDREIRGRALDRATGIPGLLEQVDDRGRTDRWLIDELSRRRLAETSGLWERYEREYVAELRATLLPLPSIALPGAAELLAALRAHGASLGVATGNLRLNAAAKLAHAQLAAFFEPLRGGFGDRFADRADIARAGAEDCGLRPGERWVVVGDTIQDVRGALSAGAVPIGVATGHASASELREAGAVAVLPNLRDTPTALRALLGHAE